MAAFVLLHSTLYQGFLFGMLVADVANSRSSQLSALMRPLASVPLICLGLFFASVPHYAEHEGTLYSVLPGVRFVGGGYAMLGACLVFLGVLLNRRLQSLLSGKAFAYIGQISYAVYAVHFLVLCSISSWMFVQLQASQPKLNTLSAIALTGAVYLIVTFIIAHLLTIYVDGPATRLANAIAKKYLRTLGQDAFSTSFGCLYDSLRNAQLSSSLDLVTGANVDAVARSDQSNP